MTDFDPWSTDQATPQTTIGHRRFNTSLVDRARKRVPDVTRASGRVFIVAGNDKFNDTYPNYEVTWHGGNNYSCSCYSLTHGDTRAKNSCSHVVAVMLYRDQHGFVSDNVITDGGNGHTEPTLPFEENGGKGNGGRAASVRSDLTVIVPSISDQRWINWDTMPLPSKFQELRPHQWDAVNEAMEMYQRGVEVVYMDAPTGSGKSLIAELIRRQTELRAFYLCHTISLQEQLARDFPYAKVLKGRSNYPTLDGDRDVTCADCTMSSPDDDCMWCSEKDQCPYQRAKGAAIQAKLAVLNTSYFLTEFNWVGQVGKQRELGILDECDTLEGALMRFVEFTLGERMLGKVGLIAPKEGSHYATLGRWLVEQFKPRLHEYQKTLRGDDLRVIRERMSCARLMADVLRIEAQVEQDETMANWVRDNRAGPLVLKPVTVGDYGDKYVWGHAKRWLCMSATIISPDELSDSTGLTGGQGEGEQGRRWEMVRVPMTFPVENRRVIVAPVADMSKKGKEAGEWEYAATALRNICDRHPNERVLVHTVSYELARFLVDRVAHTLDRPVYTYSDSSSRDLTLAKFLRDKASVLVAASMDRGVDLAGDQCLVAGSKVLMSDLSWRDIEKVQIGDTVVAIDEEGAQAYQHRQLKYAEVQATTNRTTTTLKITTTHGVIRCTANHPWLVMPTRERRSTLWREAGHLKLGDKLKWITNPVEQEVSWEAGWLAGFFDGEGYFSCSTRSDDRFSHFTVGFIQAVGPTSERAKRLLDHFGFTYRVNLRNKQASYHKQTESVVLTGGFSEVMRFLSTIRPERLIANSDLRNSTGGRIFAAEVLAIEEDGINEVYNLQTSAGTFIGDGFASHNCRVVVVAKIPFPNIGDSQISKRMHMPGGQQWYCTSPDTRLLTRDLEWVPCAKVKEGQELLAFDENGPWRQWRVSTVESTGQLTRPCYRLHLDDGISLVSSSEHLWLTWNEGVAVWKPTEELAQNRYHGNTYYPHRIIKVVDTWETDTSWESGYLAAAFDGEGHLSQSRVFDATRSKFQLCYSQRPNEMADEVYRAASMLGFRLGGYDNTRDDCLQHTVLGGKPEVLRFLGQVRPRRLLAHYNPHEIGGLWKKELVGVVGAEFLGEQEVIGMKTSTGTFIAEGFASHNSVQAIRKLVQMTGRAVRSEDDWCVTYVLDRQMTSNVLKKHKALLPQWWIEALDTKFDVRELLKVRG